MWVNIISFGLKEKCAFSVNSVNLTYSESKLFFTDEELIL